MNKHLPYNQPGNQNPAGLFPAAHAKGYKAFILLCSLMLAFLAAPFQTQAQIVTPQYFKGGGTGSNAFPFNTNSVKRSQHLYLPSDLPGALPGNILRLYVRASSAGTGTYNDFRIRLGQTAATTFPGTNSDEFFTNLTLGLTANTFTLTAPAVDGWVPIDLQIPFLYNPAQTLIVEFEMSDRQGSAGFTVRTSNTSAAPNHKRLTATTLTATSGNTSALWTDFGIDVGPSTPCSGLPTAGSTVSSSNIVCPNTNFQLSLNGNTFASGITYQWQSSPNGTTWTNITGATFPNYQTSQTTTTHYRAQLTCGTQTASSTPVMVTTTAAPVSGTYTINKANPTGGTNFASFDDAINFFKCGGLNGPLVFNVVAGSGPYTEQVLIPIIPGVSATNTVTFNGNGNTLSNPSAGGDALKLDGADYIRFNNLTIAAGASATAGTVVSLVNAANNNIFSNCTFNHNTSTTATSQVLYVYTGSSNNTFQNNTLSGAYYGIYNFGASALLNTNNQFLNNTIKDMYYYGIYNYYGTGTLIEGNDISRPTRSATTTTFYGINVTTGSTGVTISKNRIHNTHDASTSAGTVYGIYIGAAGTSGNETMIKNNAIYNINFNGTLYGFYNTGGNNTYYYHNTVSADLQTTNYTTLRGMYFLSASTNVKFMNNNISLSSPAGNKHAIYLGSTGISLQSNNNNLYAPGGNVGYYSTAHQTLANWKTANNGAYDQASVSVDPQYVNLATGDLRPSNVGMNGAGQPLAAVTDDITNSPRDPNIPDPGAFEFTVNQNDVGVTAITGVASGCGLTSTQAITITVKNFGSVPQSNIPVNYLINGTIIGTGTIPGPVAPNGTATHTFTTTANLSAAGAYNIVANTLMTGDADASNNTFSMNVANALMAGLPTLNFETPSSGINAMRLQINSKGNITETAAASRPFNGQPASSTKGMVMDATSGTGWVIPAGIADPWTTNMDHFSAASICFSPAGGNPNDPLWLSFDLKQAFKTANANTNFRVTVNGDPIGGNTANNSPANTYRPTFSGVGGTADWTKVYLDITAYKTAQTIEIRFESSVAEPYANGAGPANLIDNVRVLRSNPTGTKDNVLAASLEVFPNPSAGLFSVSVPTVKAYNLEVTDLTGKVIMKQTVKGNASQLDLKGNAQGVYLLKITSEGNTAIQKLIIQ